MKSRGMDETKIQKIQRSYRHRNQRLFRSADASLPVKWAADDAEIYSFDVSERRDQGQPNVTVKHTAASYYASRYDIPLRFPKMP